MASTNVNANEVSASTPRSLRILIVEDEALVSLYLQDVVQDLGHAVAGIAPSLPAALALAAGTPCDLAMVDVGLAGDGGDGIDAAVALRQRFGVPAIMMTGASRADLEDRLGEVAALGWLSKPYTEGDVELILAAAISNLGSGVNIVDSDRA